MSPTRAKRNPYRSRLRTEQAAATSQLILDAATRLFLGRGYAATSIDAIADEAGVGRSTVFTSAGGKPWLLKTAYDRAVAGDDEPIPVRERPHALRLFEMTDPSMIVDAYARFVSGAAQRVSAIYEVVRSAAGSDDEVDNLWADIGEQRLIGAGQIVDLIAKNGGLRKGLTALRARDIVWIYNDPGLHHALVTSRGWSQKRYRDWITDNLHHNLLGNPLVRGR